MFRGDEKPEQEPASTRFDSRWILGVILIGDERLPERLRREELVPLGSRMRTRLQLVPHTPAELEECLTHRLRAAGNAGLMTPALPGATATSTSAATASACCCRSSTAPRRPPAASS